MNKEDALRELNVYMQECGEVEQILGQTLGYPWYKDDPQNFPDATEADGVCVGEHVPSTLAKEAAGRIKRLSEENAKLREALVSAMNEDNIVTEVNGVEICTYKTFASPARAWCINDTDYDTPEAALEAALRGEDGT